MNNAFQSAIRPAPVRAAGSAGVVASDANSARARAPRRPEHNRAMRAALALLVITMLSFYLGGGLAARYRVVDSNADSAKVAAFSFDLNDGTSSHMVDLKDITKPGDTKSYTFSVLGKSEASLKYSLGLKLVGSMPLECTVVKLSSSDNPIKTTVAELDPTTGVQKGSVDWVLKPNENREDVYTLTVKWPSDKNSLEYANDSASHLIVTATVHQVD